MASVGQVNGAWAAAPAARVMRMSEERIIGAFLRLARARRFVDLNLGLRRELLSYQSRPARGGKGRIVIGKPDENEMKRA